MSWRSTPGPNRALLAAAWGLQAGIAGMLAVNSSGYLLAFNIAWTTFAALAAVICARFVNDP